MSLLLGLKRRRRTQGGGHKEEEEKQQQQQQQRGGYTRIEEQEDSNTYTHTHIHTYTHTRGARVKLITAFYILTFVTCSSSSLALPPPHSCLLHTNNLITVVLGEKKTHIELHDDRRLKVIERESAYLLIHHPSCTLRVHRQPRGTTILTAKPQTFSKFDFTCCVGPRRWWDGWGAAAVCGVLSNRRDHLHGDNLCFA